ncbi:MAG: dihydrolipoyl dehydrogenase [Firmicutes bacterium]|nr:dihydrolipoyl dehydrogenase [Bacillota bacterium]
MHYDLTIIGGGPGGYTGAIRAAKLGLKTALIEQRDLGGTCLNRGCIPTKTLLHSAEIFSARKEWESMGVIAADVKIDENKIYERKDKIVNQLRNGVETLVKAAGVDLYRAKGYIKDKNTVLAGDTALTTNYILIATGSKPQEFDPNRPLPGIDEVLNSDDVLNAPINDDNIVIIGGGVIAVEFASYFVSIGRSVTLIVTGERILRALSTDISNQLGMILKRNGLKIITSAKIKRLYKDKAVIEVGGGEQTVEGAVIAAAGRVSVLDCGLENAGVTYGKYIEVDENMRTNVNNIYACGDAAGGPQLAHYAAAGAVTAVEIIAGKPKSMDMSVCPSCIYTQPEVALVGKTTAGETDKTGKFLMGASGKAIVGGLNRGYVKIITDANDVVVGGELFCLRASDMIGEVALCIQKKFTAHEAAAVIHPHPTVMEAVGEALEDVHGMATHIPAKAK